MLRDTLTYTLPAVLSQGLGLILLPIYTRVLTRVEFGAFDLILAAAPIITIVLSLEIQQGLSRLRTDADPEAQRRMTGTAWLVMSAGFLTFLVGGLATAEPLAHLLFGRPGHAGTVRMGVLSLTATGVNTVVLSQFRWELRSRTYAALSTAYAVVTVGLTVPLTVLLDLGLTGVLMAQAISAGATTVVGLVLLRHSWRPVVDVGQLRRMLAFSLPLVPASLSVIVTLYFNRLALRYFGDLGDVASYGAAARLAGFVGLLVIGMQSAVTPLVYNHYKDSEAPRQLAHLFSGVVGVCVVACVALNALAADLTSVFAGRAYLSSAGLVALIAPALLMGQLYVFAPGMGIALRTKAQLGVAVAAAIVDVVANLVLVPALGALGAALATVMSSATFLGLWVAVSQRHYPIPFEVRRLALGLTIFAAASVAADVVRSSSDAFAPMGLALKALVVLATLGLLYRARLFEGVVQGMRSPTAPTEDPSARATG
ncbi:lipopolysaccharide biosynthesis protein [Pedococcus sp. 2YAF34]|uniref:lipopolysaccharide biosynthesis protein n=1 Tax=Pedococcus sp. 2YAF34 TaxID=3233032 RepID=UPI003F986B5B